MLKAIDDFQSNFLLRRIHSLSGLMPIGGFMIFHLFANSLAMFSPDNYNTFINFLRAIPFLLPLEVIMIYGPITFHALYGVVISRTAKPNALQYSHIENWRYVLMRATGLIGLVYLSYHMFQFRTVHDLDYDFIARSLAGDATISFLPNIPFINPFNVYWFYIIGVVSLIFHLSNGIWSFCITWGITVGKKSQEMVSWASIGLFITLCAIAIPTLNNLRDSGLELLAQ